MPGGPLVVRDATPDDAALLSAVGRDSFDAAYGATTDPASIDQHLEDYFSEGSIRDEMCVAGRSYKIALLGELAAGLIKLRRDPPPPEIISANVVEVQHLYVLTEFQGYGVGRALMDATVVHARRQKLDGIWLQVWSEADWALRFYERNGFVRVGDIDYELGERVYDDWLMLRRL